MSDYGNKLVKAVERCAALALERDQQAAYCAFLESAMKEVLNKFADSDSLHHYLNIINSTPAQSLLIHDAEVLEKAVATWKGSAFNGQPGLITHICKTAVDLRDKAKEASK